MKALLHHPWRSAKVWRPEQESDPGKEVDGSAVAEVDRTMADGDDGDAVVDDIVVVVVVAASGGAVNRIPCTKAQDNVEVSIHSCCCLHGAQHHDDRGHVRDRRLDGGTKSAAAVVVVAVVDVVDQHCEDPFLGTRVDRGLSTHLPNPSRDCVA